MWINLTDDEIASIEASYEYHRKDFLGALVRRISKEKLTWIRNPGYRPAGDPLVDVEFRHGGIATNRPAMEWDWIIDGGDCDIVAYRLTP